MIIYEIKIQLDGGLNLIREVYEYNVYQTDKDKSYTMSRKGSIGTYILQHSALDSQYGFCGGIHFYTKDKSKIKEYCKLCDEYMRKYIGDKQKILNKHLSKLDSAWLDGSSTKKSKNNEDKYEGSE